MHHSPLSPSSPTDARRRPMSIRGLAFHFVEVDGEAVRWSALLPTGTRLDLAEHHVTWDPEHWHMGAIRADGICLDVHGDGVTAQDAYDALHAMARRSGDLRTLEALVTHKTGSAR